MRAPGSRQPNTSHDVRLLKRLLECTRLLNSTLDLRELTRIVLGIVQKELDFERGTVFVLDSENRFLRSFVAQGVEEFEITLPIGTGIAGSVAQTGQILDIPDAARDERFQPEFDERLSYRTKDFYCMPIVNGDGACVGVLQLLNRNRPMTENDKEFLASISVHFGIALERAWFHHEMQEKHRMEQEMHKVQNELAQLEKLSLMGTLTSGLVHEVRNPLSVLLTHTTMMKEDPSLSDELAARLAIVDYSAQRTMDIVKGFLAFSLKDEDGLKVPGNINDAIRKTLDLLEHECRNHNVSLSRNLGKLPAIPINIGQIQQVLLNLLKNAIDSISHNQASGSIIVHSFLKADGETVRVEVSDDGPGVPEEIRQRLFEPFFTSKGNGVGTGLGLSTSRRLIEGHDGHIGYETRSEKGATFWFELPHIKACAEPVDEQLARINAELNV